MNNEVDMNRAIVKLFFIIMGAIIFVAVLARLLDSKPRSRKSKKRCSELCPDLNIPCITSKCEPYCTEQCTNNGEIDYICMDYCYNN